MIRSSKLLVFGFAFLFACSAGLYDWGDAENIAQASPARYSPQDRILMQRGAMVTGMALLTIVNRQEKKIKEGGVSKAIHMCNTTVNKILLDLGKRYSTKVTRVSHRYRNPKNKANAYEMTVIRKYLSAMKKKKPLIPVIRKVSAKEKVFYSPIVIVYPLCLKCHGHVGKDVKTTDYIRIKKLYPKGIATGFQMGHLRGLWKVTFKK